MKSNKGFTLVELLAVIVILAIVALVATPVILNIIESSTNKAKDSSARLVIKSVELAYTTYISKNDGNIPKKSELITEFNGMMDSNTNWTATADGKGEIKASDDNVLCDTTTPSAGKLRVTCNLATKKNGEVQSISTKDLSITAE